MPDPVVTVVMPTYRRHEPQMVRVAIESVQAQTVTNWELVVSDDEEPAGETWQVLTEIAAADPRVRPVQNRGRHGEASNSNNALVHATAPWLKILHSDDVLVPHCLETMLEAVEGLDSVILACCLESEYRDGKLVRLQRRGRHRVELVESSYARLGMYRQEVGPGPPSLVMVRRQAVEEGYGLFTKLPGVVAGGDADWSMRVLAHGDLLLINEVLVQRHKGPHATTSNISEEQLDEALEFLRPRYLAFMDAELGCPPLATMIGALRLIRAANRLKKRRFRDAVGLVLKVRRPRSWGIAARWVLQTLWPGRFRVLPYRVIRERTPG